MSLAQRKSNTAATGGAFDQATVNLVWEKAQIVPGYDQRNYRKERCGAWIQKSSYGTTGNFGWEIDHIKPMARGGKDELSNLQPLHWRNNRGKGDDYPNWTCSLTAQG